MFRHRIGSARQTVRWRARTRQILTGLDRSRELYFSMHGITILVILAGLAFLTWGLVSEVSTFREDTAALVRFAGSDGMLSSAAGFIQYEVLDLIGIGAPDRQEEAIVIPPGGATPVVQASSADRKAADGDDRGFLPYQVPLSLSGKHAPPVPQVPVTSRDPLLLARATATAAAYATAEAANAAAAATAESASTATAAAATVAAMQTPTPPALDTPPPTQTPLPPTETPVPTEPPPTATVPPPAIPSRISIPSIGLDAPVVVASLQTVWLGGQTFEQWQAPNFFAAGWQEGSAMLGEPGNTVLNGHHNIYGEVFSHLRDLVQGDEIIVYADDQPYHYVVSQTMKVKERDASLDERQQNALWVLPSDDERLTLVTCWPPTSNAYRLIIVAVPIK